MLDHLEAPICYGCDQSMRFVGLAWAKVSKGIKPRTIACWLCSLSCGNQCFTRWHPDWFHLYILDEGKWQFLSGYYSLAGIKDVIDNLHSDGIQTRVRDIRTGCFISNQVVLASEVNNAANPLSLGNKS